MDIVLILITLVSFSFGSMSLGYAWGVTKQLKKMEQRVAVGQPTIKVGGESDVCKDADWMPFGEV